MTEGPKNHTTEKLGRKIEDLPWKPTPEEKEWMSNLQSEYRFLAEQAKSFILNSKNIEVGCFVSKSFEESTEEPEFIFSLILMCGDYELAFVKPNRGDVLSIDNSQEEIGKFIVKLDFSLPGLRSFTNADNLAKKVAELNRFWIECGFADMLGIKIPFTVPNFAKLDRTNHVKE